MWNMFKQIGKKLGKPFLFATYSAIGCLLAATVMGEAWLAWTQLPPTAETSQSYAITLLIDTSSSMVGNKLDEVKTAAQDFVERQDLSRDQIAVVGFGNGVNINTALTQDVDVLQSAITQLSASGGTPMADGIEAAANLLASSDSTPSILLFTDGLPTVPFLFPEMSTIQSARSVRTSGVNIVAVATGGAETGFLADLTGDPNLVFYASTGDFQQAFEKAEDAILNPQLVESEASGTYSLRYSMFRVGGWAGLLALGIALALTLGQSTYLKRRTLVLKEIGLSIIGGYIAGIVAGAVGQLLFLPVGTMPLLAIVARVLGWTILGTLTGAGMSRIVPNLKLSRSLLGGTIGGGLGALGFLWAAASFNDMVGRLIGSAILGFFIGLMIALIEQFSRNAWLVVHWNKSEQTKISLGAEPVYFRQF